MNKIGFVVALLDETNDLRKELKVLKEEKADEIRNRLNGEEEEED